MITKDKNISSSEVFKGHRELTFGEVLRAWRLSEELSQADLAALLGMSRSNICDIEKGRKIPSPSRVVRIARKLGMCEPHAVELVLQDMLRSEKIKLKVSVVS